MLTVAFLFLVVGFMLTIFNTVSFKFVRDQEKSKAQAIAGIICLIIGLVLLAKAIMGLMEPEI